MGRTFVFGFAFALLTAACTPVEAPGGVHAPPGKAPVEECGAAADGCNTTPGQKTVASAVESMPGKDAGAPPRATGDAGTAHAVGADMAAAGSGESQNAGRAGSAATSTSRMSSDAGSGAAQASVPPSAGAGGRSGDDLPSGTKVLADALVRPDASECEYVEIRARGDANGSPFQVPTGDIVQCFLIDQGFDAPTQALEFKPLVDAYAIVQNIVLRTLDRSEMRGPVVSCADMWPTHQMVAVWRPGYDDWYYPADMGIDMGRGLFLLEVNYSNTSGASQPDRSGMRVCTTKKVRPRTASMSWLGNQLFTIPPGARDYPVSGRCTPQMQTDPIHILRIAPFMHDHGKRVTMQIDRIDGTTQQLIDAPFGGGAAKVYDMPATLRAGDTILSTCYFDNPNATNLNIGVTNDKELCHFFVLAYPAHALVGDRLLGIENNSCLGTP